ncbi:MAG: efflux RND transporter periplasmic adaptor subunit [Acidobacteriaceae bacterium]|nr:efflux RND transporter periplasmic adaptor subunit [Acidobacteriaceae bacterium]
MKRRGLYFLLLLVGLIAGLALGRIHHETKPNISRRILYYEDPMHPTYRSDKPGIAPDCGMDLVPVYAEDAGTALASIHNSAPGTVAINPAVQQLYGIRLAKAEMDQGRGTIRAFAHVEADQTRIFRVTVGTEGYVKQTQDDAVGNRVAKNQHLATIYSPDFIALAGGYLAANESVPASVITARESANSTNNQGLAGVQARADRLRNLGMSDVQIEEITRTHKLPEEVYVVSPTDGFILTRSITPGLRFERQAELYTIGDLSHVWIIAEVFGRDAKTFRPGTAARVTLPETGESFRATVSNVLPEVDPVTRTLRVRLEVDNPGFKLRPNMYVSVDLPITLPAGLSVPEDAILDSGLSKRVFVQASEGQFESRRVEVGWQLGDRVQILKGLRAGDLVVSSGTFLVDSESRLQLADTSGGSMNAASPANAPVEHRMN